MAVAIATPILSCGLLTPLVFGVMAARRGSRPLGFAALGYLALVGASLVTVNRGGYAEDVFMLSTVLGGMITGSVHAALLYLPPKPRSADHHGDRG